MPLTVRLFLIAVFAFAGYRRAAWFRTRHGRSPWGWPPLVWGAVFGVSLFVACLLLAVAERSGRRVSAGSAMWPGPAMPSADRAPVPFGGQPAGPPQGWGAPSAAPPSGGAPPTRAEDSPVRPVQGWTPTSWQEPEPGT